jgi:multicomponent Na+:H+ antiporter subunit E
MQLGKAKIGYSTTVSRGLLFSLIWWVLTDGAAPSWWIGVPAVLIAVAASSALFPPAHLIWYKLLRYVPFFLMRSLLGGADVAWRVFHPRMPIAPDLIEYPMRLPPGLARVFMVNAVSLVPGTLSAELGADCLKVHVLGGRKEYLSELEALERCVARMMNASLMVSEGGE